MQDKIEALINQMSVLEKAILTVGKKFWFTRGLKKYGIKSYMVSDGPHGLRKQSNATDNLGLNESIKATCFPPAVTMASGWDISLAEEVGEKIAEEAIEEELGVVLGPGVNIKRSPLCGRNFEYFSEDPLLAGKMGAAWIKGVQKHNIGTSLKHFAVNNQEDNRLRIDAVVDERAFREIYLRSFEIAVKEGQPYTVMCAYNKINGTFASENKYLLTDILKEEWGYKGYVMTDWGAINNRIKAKEAGLDLEMPGGSGEAVYDIVKGIENKELSIDALNDAVMRLLEVYFKIKDNKANGFHYDREEHHLLARKVATKSAVLLKNEDNILPLDKSKPIIAIGALCEHPRYQGSGSSLINPHKVESVLDMLKEGNYQYSYSEGFSHIVDKVDTDKENAAYNLCKDTEGTIVLFMGLTMFYESEGFDRKHLRLPDNQLSLIKRLATLNKKMVVVLYGGSAVELPFVADIKALLNMYLPGQACGSSTLDLLFGNANPCGKLAETYPIKLEDTPCYKYFPEGIRTVEYRESIFVGYRYYDTAKKNVLFPFGFGLSYTNYRYSDISVENADILNDGKIKVTMTLANTGAIAGEEIVQVYVSKSNSDVYRASKELVEFQKVKLNSKESKKVTFLLDKRAFTYYNIYTKQFEVESGDYTILVGSSSQDIKLSYDIVIKTKDLPSPYNNKLADSYYLLDNKKAEFRDEAFWEILKRCPPKKEPLTKPYTDEYCIKELKERFLGRLMLSCLNVGANMMIKGKDENTVITRNFLKEMVITNSLRSLATTSGGAFSRESLAGIVLMLNKKRCKGLKTLVRGFRQNKKQLREIDRIEEE